MEDKIRIETVLTGLATAWMLLFVFLIPADIIDFYRDKETYAKVYGLNTDHTNWELEYLSRWIYVGILTVVGLTVVTLRLARRDSGTIKKINWAFLFIYFGSMIIGFYNWMKAGVE